MKKITSYLLILFMVFGLALNTQAANKAVTEGKKAKVTTVKTGSTKVTKNNSGSGYVKFTAPKAGTYQFTFSGLHLNKPNPTDNAIADFFLCIKNKNNTMVRQDIYKRSNGKYDQAIEIGSAYYVSKRTYPASASPSSKYLTKRTVSKKMKKGQTIYIEHRGNGDPKSPVYYTLTIKKK